MRTPNLVDDIAVQTAQRGLLEDELAVHDQGEQLT